MGSHRQSVFRHAWRKVLVALAVFSFVGLERISPTESQEAPGDDTQSEQLLSPEQVVDGLAVRIERMRERHDRQLGSAEDAAPRDYNVDLPSADLGGPAPPDALGGEIEIERDEDLR